MRGRLGIERHRHIVKGVRALERVASANGIGDIWWPEQHMPLGQFRVRVFHCVRKAERVHVALDKARASVLVPREGGMRALGACAPAL